MNSSAIKRSVVVDGRETSISVENPYCFGPNSIATNSGMHVSELAGAIKSKRMHGKAFTSAVRVCVFAHFRDCLQAVAGITRENAPRATAFPTDYRGTICSPGS
jgi:predicted DNA-binding ribbon-helix-helix protein